MSKSNIDFSKYDGEWIAISDGNVIANGKNGANVYREASAKKDSFRMRKINNGLQVLTSNKSTKYVEVVANMEVCKNCGYVKNLSAKKYNDSCRNLIRCDGEDIEKVELIRKEDYTDKIKEMFGVIDIAKKELRDDIARCHEPQPIEQFILQKVKDVESRMKSRFSLETINECGL